MANTLGPTGTILNTEQFPALRNYAARLGRFSMDASAAIETSGKTVEIEYDGTYTASVVDANGDYTTAARTTTVKNVTMLEPFHVQTYLTPNQVASFGPEYLQSHGTAPAIAVFDEVKKQNLSLLAQATTIVVGYLSSSYFNFNAVLSASAAVSSSSTNEQLSFLVPATVFNALVADAKNSSYSTATVTQDGERVLRYDSLPWVDVVLEPGISTPIIASRGAIGFGLRLPPQGEGFERTIIADERTGVSIASDFKARDENGRAKHRMQVIWGGSVGRPGLSAKYVWSD